MATFNLTVASNLYKTKYAKISENVYNSYNVSLARFKKSYDFVGRQMFKPIPQSFSGGVGSGTLPTPNYENVEDAILTASKMYGTVAIDRESIKAASTDEGAFIKQTKHSAQKTVESWNRNLSRAIFNSLPNGALSGGDNATNVTGTGTVVDPYVVVMGAGTWKEANWEERDFVNYSNETTLLEVVTVAPATRTVSFVGTSAGLAALTGVGPVPLATYFYMQGSRGNDPQSLIGALLAVSPATLYTIPVTRRWQAYQAASGGAGVTLDMMNTDMLSIEKRCGKVPNLIIAGYTQFRKILNQIEDKKYYNVDPRAENLKGKISFRGLEFMSTMGPVPMFAERFLDEDTIIYLNDDFIEICHRPDFGWFDDDGTVFLRSSTDDSYEARYGGYLQVYTAPNFHGIRNGLAT